MYLYRGSHLSPSYDGLWDLLKKRAAGYNFGILWHSGLGNHVCNWLGLVDFDKGKGLLKSTISCSCYKRTQKAQKMRNIPAALNTEWQSWHWPTCFWKILPEQWKLQVWDATSTCRAPEQQRSPRVYQKKNPHRFCVVFVALREKSSSSNTPQPEHQQHRAGTNPGTVTPQWICQVWHSMAFAHQAMHNQVLPNKKAQN